MLNTKYSKINLIKFYHTILMFILALTWLLIYLFSVTRNPLPVYIFWASVIFLSFLIVWQIDKVENRFQEIIVLSEIVVLGFVFHLIFVVTVPYGLFGRDVHFGYYIANMIAKYGWPIPDSVIMHSIARDYSKWPAMYIIAIIFSNILNINLFSINNPLTVAKWMPSIISLGTPLVYYILVKNAYNKIKISLLAVFSMNTLFSVSYTHLTLPTTERV